MRRLLALVFCTGCMLPSMNREGLQLVVNDLNQARTSVEATAKGLNAVIVEINTAIAEERPPVIAEKMKEVTVALAATTDSLDEAGKTTVTLQSGIGIPKPEKNLNFTSSQKAMWRTKYIAMAAAFKKAMSWLKDRSPIPIPGGVASANPQPWSGTDIAALLAAITTGAAALGFGGQKVNTLRKGANEAEGLADIVKEKCNGSGEFATTITNFPTTQKRHIVRKASAL